MGRIGQVDEGLAGQFGAQRLQDAQAANAAVEDPDGRAAQGWHRRRDGTLRGGLPLSHA